MITDRSRPAADPPGIVEDRTMRIVINAEHLGSSATDDDAQRLVADLRARGWTAVEFGPAEPSGWDFSSGLEDRDGPEAQARRIRFEADWDEIVNA